MSPTAPRPTRSWLGLIQGLLLGMLILDFVALPLSVLPNGQIRVGSVGLLDLWGNSWATGSSTWPCSACPRSCAGAWTCATN